MVSFDLLSALGFHNIGTQIPANVWLAVERKSALPTSMNTQLRVVRLSGASFTDGIEEHKIEGVKVRVYNPAKTVADCFNSETKSVWTWRWRHCANVDVAKGGRLKRNTPVNLAASVHRRLVDYAREHHDEAQLIPAYIPWKPKQQ